MLTVEISFWGIGDRPIGDWHMGDRPMGDLPMGDLGGVSDPWLNDWTPPAYWLKSYWLGYWKRKMTVMKLLFLEMNLLIEMFMKTGEKRWFLMGDVNLTLITAVVRFCFFVAKSPAEMPWYGVTLCGVHESRKCVTAGSLAVGRWCLAFSFTSNLVCSLFNFVSNTK